MNNIRDIKIDIVKELTEESYNLDFKDDQHVGQLMRIGAKEIVRLKGIIDGQSQMNIVNELRNNAYLMGKQITDNDAIAELLYKAADEIYILQKIAGTDLNNKGA